MVDVLTSRDWCCRRAIGGLGLGSGGEEVAVERGRYSVERVGSATLPASVPVFYNPSLYSGSLLYRTTYCVVLWVARKR